MAPAADAAPVLGAAADGDADRNMILGRGFVTLSYLLAVIAAHAHLILFKNEGGLKALARSMPTSGAVDRVAAKLGLPLYETPTGWKFFGNLMDSHLLGGADLTPLLCGEESFGTGSSHVREKDGLWAVLCWLSILAHHNLHTPHGALVGVGDVVRQHWREFGRNFYTRYDYEEVDAAKAKELVAHLAQLGLDGLGAGGAAQSGFVLSTVDEFAYTDPVDGCTRRTRACASSSPTDRASSSGCRAPARSAPPSACTSSGTSRPTTPPPSRPRPPTPSRRSSTSRSALAGARDHRPRRAHRHHVALRAP